MITRKTKGCLLAVLLAIGLVSVFGWQVQEPSRRADFVHDKIQIGMSVLEIEQFMSGRHYTLYRVRRSGEWKLVSREEFSAAIKTPQSEGAQETELVLQFFGIANRTAIIVHSDSVGRVLNVSGPKGWG